MKGLTMMLAVLGTIGLGEAFAPRPNMGLHRTARAAEVRTQTKPLIKTVEKIIPIRLLV